MQLNYTATNLPRALIIKWLIQIQLQDFNIRHILRKKNSLADRLLQQLSNGEQPNKPTKDIKEFINYKLNALEYIVSPFKMKAGLPLKDLYLKKILKDCEIASDLTVFKRDEY